MNKLLLVSITATAQKVFSMLEYMDEDAGDEDSYEGAAMCDEFLEIESKRLAILCWAV
jgi:hypothetical protein